MRNLNVLNGKFRVPVKAIKQFFGITEDLTPIDNDLEYMSDGGNRIKLHAIYKNKTLIAIDILNDMDD